MLAYWCAFPSKNELKRIRQQFGSLVSGKTGYAYIIASDGRKGIGEFVMHPKFQDKQIGELDIAEANQVGAAPVLAQKNGVFRYPFVDASGTTRGKRSSWPPRRRPGDGTVATGSWLDGASRKASPCATCCSWPVWSRPCCWRRWVHPGQFPPALAEADGCRMSSASPAAICTVIHGAEANSRNEVHVIGCAFSHMAENMRSLVRVLRRPPPRWAWRPMNCGAAMPARESSARPRLGVRYCGLGRATVGQHHARGDNANQRRPRFPKEAKRVTTTGRDVVSRHERTGARRHRHHRSAVLIESLGERSSRFPASSGSSIEIADQTSLLALNAAIGRPGPPAGARFCRRCRWGAQAGDGPRYPPRNRHHRLGHPRRNWPGGGPHADLSTT